MELIVIKEARIDVAICPDVCALAMRFAINEFSFIAAAVFHGINASAVSSVVLIFSRIYIALDCGTDSFPI